MRGRLLAVDSFFVEICQIEFVGFFKAIVGIETRPGHGGAKDGFGLGWEGSGSPVQNCREGLMAIAFFAHWNYPKAGVIFIV